MGDFPPSQSFTELGWGNLVGCGDLFHFYADLGGSGISAFCAYEANARANMWQGNTVTIFLHVLDGGIQVADLAAAVSGTFHALGRRDNALGTLKNYPGDFTVDDPEVGVCKVVLDATDTDTLSGEYDLAVEFTWVDKKYEWRFQKTLNVMRDQVLFP